jgi:RNA polymerase sigma-70 factor, ECF subfamily
MHSALDHSSPGDARAGVFQAQRQRLWSIAYGIVGSPEDADDLVQEAYVRWHRSDHAGIRQPEAWLVTTVTRLGIDRLRALQAERRAYIGPWLPTPLVEVASADREAELASELSLAFVTLLERLAPEERAAFLLRDVFDADYADIARVLGRSETACRQVVSRARTRVRAADPRFRPDRSDIERLARQFNDAVLAADYDTLLALLSPDASYITDGGGRTWAARRIVKSADKVARCVIGVARKRRILVTVEERMVLVNGEPGIITVADGRPVAVTAFQIRDDRIHRILRVLNPDKLRHIRAD